MAPMSKTAAETVSSTRPTPPRAPPPPTLHHLRAVNCNIFLCDDSDCGDDCRVVEGRDQVEVKADMGIVYGNIVDANGENFETHFDPSVT